MERLRHLRLRFSSNIRQYEVTVYDGCAAYRQTYAGQGCLCLRSRSSCIRVVARPLTEGYSALLYYWIDTTCQATLSLHFNFPQTPAPPVGVNRFTLTDANYGLPIDGALLFTGT